MKIAIVGQQDFGKAVLEAFLARGDQVAAVFCAPEKEGARPDALRVAAQEKGLKLHQFKSLKAPEAVQAMKDAGADLGIMAFVLQFAPQEFVNVPKHGTISLVRVGLVTTVWIVFRVMSRGRLNTENTSEGTTVKAISAKAAMKPWMPRSSLVIMAPTPSLRWFSSGRRCSRSMVPGPRPSLIGMSSSAATYSITGIGSQPCVLVSAPTCRWARSSKGIDADC